MVETNATPMDFDSQLTYTGAVSDDVVLTLDESALPVGWSAEIVWNSTTYPSTVTIPAMTTNQVENIRVHVTPGPTGVGSVVFTAAPFHNASTAAAEIHPYHTFSQTPAILLVDDDQGATFETIFQNAILGAGYYSVTHQVTSAGNPTSTFLGYFDAVVWTTGELPTLTIGPMEPAAAQAVPRRGGGSSSAVRAT